MNVSLPPAWLTALWSFLIHDLIVITLIPTVLMRRKESAATIAWMLAIVLMPFFGALAFLAFGNDRLARQVDRRGERKRTFQRRRPQATFSYASPINDPCQMRMSRLMDEICDNSPVLGNDVEFFVDMDRNYEEQLAAIEQAVDHVHVEYYIFKADEIGGRFRAALIAAARRGVKVRFVYDAVGSMWLTGSFLREMRDAGVELAAFIPFNLLTRRWIFNFRTHRKILIVDGTVGFTGGANIGEEYLGLSDIGLWRDTHLRLRGPAVMQMQRVFAEDWAFASGKVLDPETLSVHLPWEGNVIAQVIAGGPDQEVATYHEVYFTAIASANRRIRITTPYFVPSEALQVALQTAARRGVDVQILVPGRHTKSFLHMAARSYYEELLEAGVRIHEYTPGFLHSKILTIDGSWSVVGTANFDNRSMKLNFEIGVAFYDTRIARQLDLQFDEDASRASEVDLDTWGRRNLGRKVGENFTRLFSPIL